MRVFAISDLHTDFQENLLLLSSLSPNSYRDDILIVAGDIADKLSIIGKTLRILRPKFRRVVYTPGNHELWVRTDDCNSIEKLHKILALCGQTGIDTAPLKAEGVWIVPLFSWYSPSFAGDEACDEEELAGWADFYFCSWPDGLKDIPAFFLKMNERHIVRYDAPVISLSHFLPRRDLLPEVEHLKFKSLPKVAGCPGLDEQIRRLGSSVHIFGHSHITCDRVIEGVRYVHNALGYPKDREITEVPLKMVWDTCAEQEQLESLSAQS